MIKQTNKQVREISKMDTNEQTEARTDTNSTCSHCLQSSQSHSPTFEWVQTGTEVENAVQLILKCAHTKIH